MELIKNTIKLGNSAGVLLPKEFLNMKVKVVLQPLNIEKDILDILLQEKVLPHVLGVYLVGSYARNEQTIESDVDVLVITDNLNDRIEKGKYDLMLVSKGLADEKMKKDIFPILPMMIECKTIINKKLLSEYVNTPLTIRNLKWYIDTTKTMMKRALEEINFAKKTKRLVSDAAAYSLILRLRTLYIIGCLRKESLWTKKEFLDLTKKVSGSLIAYERYLDSKKNNSKKSKLPVEEAEKLMEYINKKNEEIEKWLKQKRRREKKG